MTEILHNSKDILGKTLFGSIRFVCLLVNYLLFQGSQVVRDENVMELSPHLYTVEVKNSRIRLAVERVRDDLFAVVIYHDNIVEGMYIGIEPQTYRQYMMVLRTGTYDCMTYLELYRRGGRRLNLRQWNRLKEGEHMDYIRRKLPFLPVHTCVINMTGKPWTGPVCMHELFPMEWKSNQTLGGQYYHLIDPYCMKDVDLAKFKEIGILLSCLKYQDDDASRERYMLKYSKGTVMTPELAGSINLLTGSDIEVTESKDKEGDEVTVEKFGASIERRGFAKGEKQGFANGEKQGFTKGEKQGFRNGCYETLIEAVKSNAMKLAAAAKIARVSEEEMRRIVTTGKY